LFVRLLELAGNVMAHSATVGTFLLSTTDNRTPY